MMLMLMMMMMMEKNRAGVNLMTLVFLASLSCSVTTGNSVESYEHLSALDLETELNSKITQAKKQGQCFYVGVAKQHGTTPIQSLCNRQGERDTKPDATKCTKPSTHCADERAGTQCDAELTKVYYADDFNRKAVVCGIEKSLISKYCSKGLTPCLNREVGNNNCIKARKGIVYLRIYKPESTTQECVATKIDAPKPGKRTISMTEDDSPRRSKRIRKPVDLFQML